MNEIYSVVLVVSPSQNQQQLILRRRSSRDGLSWREGRSREEGQGSNALCREINQVNFLVNSEFT